MFAVHEFTKISVIDNSGASWGRCIQLYRASLRCGAKSGAIILLALQVVEPDKKIKKGDLTKSVIVCSQDWVERFSSNRLKPFARSVVLLFNTSLLPRAKRAHGLMLEEVLKGFSQSSKTLALASVII